MSADITRIGVAAEDVVTDREIEMTCQRYCKQVWGRDLASRSAVLMFLRALEHGGYRVVRT